MRLALSVLLLLLASPSGAQEGTYGNRLARLPQALVAALAEHSAPNADGAIGRNRKSYFHARFQTGLHHLADAAIVETDLKAAADFLGAAEYAFRHQLPDGDFSLVVPPQLQGRREAGTADRVSGVAFFASSLGAGVLALQTNDWFMRSEQCEPFRARLDALKPKMRLTLNFLVERRGLLEVADRRAPNRLLFDALAFHALGKILHDAPASTIASGFVESALDQVHADGYFIEAGGFDSSYNGVAAALGFRLVLLGYVDVRLESACDQAIRWQPTRINADGEIVTRGNARVDPRGHGESFLGRRKDVDVGHTVEAFMLASLATGDARFVERASTVLSHYR